MPHRVEIAPSGRAKCRACTRSLTKDSQRFAEAAPNPVAEGETSHFYHLRCAAERRPEAFLEWVEIEPDEAAALEDIDQLRAAAELAKSHRRLPRVGKLSQAPTARARCRHCEETIEKGSTRLALQPIEEGRLGNWGFLHPGCITGYVGFQPDADRVMRYSDADASLREEITRALSAPPVPAPPDTDPTATEPE